MVPQDCAGDISRQEIGFLLNIKFDYPCIYNYKQGWQVTLVFFRCRRNTFFSTILGKKSKKRPYNYEETCTKLIMYSTNK